MVRQEKNNPWESVEAGLDVYNQSYPLLRTTRRRDESDNMFDQA